MKKKMAQAEGGHILDIREESPREFHMHEISETSPISSAESGTAIPLEPGNQVKVNFEKFAQLMAMHNFQEVLKKNPNEEIIVSSNLLTDLANAHEEPRSAGNRSPLLFAFGLILGVVMTYILFQF